MSMEEHQSIKGELTLVAIAADGRVLERRVVRNLITRGGKRLLAELLAGTLDGGLDLSIAVGSGGQEVNVEDTKLSEPAEEVAVEERSIQHEPDGGVRLRVSAKLPRRASGKEVTGLREAGIVVRRVGARRGDDETALAWPLLFNRVRFDVISRAANVELLFAWDITF